MVIQNAGKVKYLQIFKEKLTTPSKSINNRLRDKTAFGGHMKKIFDTVVIGGGASGLMCALRLAERGVRDVLLLERNDRVGRKLSVTGNGQGNVTNTDMSAQHYFGSGRETVAAVLKQYDEKWLVGELTSLGGLFAADGTGRVYPASRQASAVTDLFRFGAGRARRCGADGRKGRSGQARRQRFCGADRLGGISCPSARARLRRQSGFLPRHRGGWLCVRRKFRTHGHAAAAFPRAVEDG